MAGASIGPTGAEPARVADRHAVRRTYQHGCRCARCTDANTQYSARYREARKVGRPLLGAHVAGTEAARLIAALVEEGYLKREIATWLGHQWPVLHWGGVPGKAAGVTVRTTLRLRAISRRVCGWPPTSSSS
jgi:hypothetical protein